MSMVPFLRTPFSDVIYSLAPLNQAGHDDPLCMKLQLKLLDCLEAYGLDKGKYKCFPIFNDFSECCSTTFQKRRYDAIQNERKKQYKEGKISKLYDEDPVLDLYINYV